MKCRFEFLFWIAGAMQTRSHSFFWWTVFTEITATLIPTSAKHFPSVVTHDGPQTNLLASYVLVLYCFRTCNIALRFGYNEFYYSHLIHKRRKSYIWCYYKYFVFIIHEFLFLVQFLNIINTTKYDGRVWVGIAYEGLWLEVITALSPNSAVLCW